MDIATRPDKPNGARATGVRPGPPAGLVPAAAGSFRPVTVRAVAIACALMPPLALWVIQAELVLDSGYPTAISLFYHVTFAILAIAAINLWVEKRWPRAALSGGTLSYV
ncbi:MAG: hypothetical protein M1457_01930, partial [bacterium]|nr:hypothetical protein [bacterium]